MPKEERGSPVAYFMELALWQVEVAASNLRVDWGFLGCTHPRGSVGGAAPL